MGISKPGTEIYDQKEKINDKIMINGSIEYQKSRSYINNIAAEIWEAKSCDGWTYWHEKTGDYVKNMDGLRERIRHSNYGLWYAYAAAAASCS